VLQLKFKERQMLKAAIGIGVLACSLVLISTVHALPPLPEPTTGFCVNTVTGAIRMQLSAGQGFVRSCRKTELGIDLQTLQVLPPEAPSPAIEVIEQLPSAMALPTPRAIPPAAATPLEVVDSKGQLVGTVVGFDSMGNVYVSMNATGQSLAIPVNGSGFTTTEDLGAPETVYVASDCKGTPFFVLNLPFLGSPLTELISTGFYNEFTNTTGVIGSSVFYGNGPASMVTVDSSMTFNAPTSLSQILASEGVCGFPNVGNGGFALLAGAPAIATLTSFVPPFTIQQ
jgi:hypothetical protein